jgi:hypothetical protein
MKLMKTCTLRKSAIGLFKSLIAVAIVCGVGPVNATELLVNGNFNDPASGSPPTGWTPWSWNAGWASHTDNSDGTNSPDRWEVQCRNTQAFNFN